VNGESRAGRPLGCVLERDGRPEQRHDPVPGHLVDRAPVVSGKVSAAAAFEHVTNPRFLSTDQMQMFVGDADLCRHTPIK
jgi:hypothetical protein